MAAGKGLQKPMNLSSELQAVVGAGPMSRPAVVKALWVYIKANGLQDQTNKRNINADDKLRKVFGKDSTNMFEMNKLISSHLTPVASSSNEPIQFPKPSAPVDSGESMQQAA